MYRFESTTSGQTWSIRIDPGAGVKGSSQVGESARGVDARRGSPAKRLSGIMARTLWHAQHPERTLSAARTAPGPLAPVTEQRHDGPMADAEQTLTSTEIAASLPSGWTQSGESITARYDTGDFATGLDLVNRIGAAAEAAGHHPDLTLTYPSVTVTLTSHDVGGVTRRDLDLAELVARHAATLGVSPAQE